MSSPRHGPCSCDIPERVARKDRAGEILPDLSGCLRKCAQNSGHYPLSGQGIPLNRISTKANVELSAPALLHFARTWDITRRTENDAYKKSALFHASADFCGLERNALGGPQWAA